LSAGGGDHLLDVCTVAVFAVQVVQCGRDHDQTFKILTTVLTMKFINRHVSTPVEMKKQKMGVK
jgi:hypothetical protein